MRYSPLGIVPIYFEWLATLGMTSSQLRGAAILADL